MSWPTRLWPGRNRRKAFAGCNVLITGGSRGLGLALARQLVQQGARVALLARDQTQLRRAQQELERSLGGEVETVVCDLRDPVQIEHAFSALLERWGRLDILINNAGIIQLGAAEHKEIAEYEAAMALHFWAPLHTMRAVIPSMKKQGGGRIINISAVEGKVALPHMAPYCASKFALTGLSDALRAELRREGIHVTTVSPGLIRTGAPPNAPQQLGAAQPYRWFTLATVGPLLTMNSERAARRILRACHRRERSLELGLPTKLLIRASAFAPNTVARLMELVNALVPVAAGSTSSASAARGG